MEITAIDAGIICILCFLLGIIIVLVVKLGEIRIVLGAVYKTLKELKNEIH